MSVFNRAAGFQGNEALDLPSGGGAFRYAETPTVPGVYSGACPGDPGCPGRAVENSPSTSWSDIGKEIFVAAATKLISRELGPKDSPGNRTVPINSKGEVGSQTEKISDPFWSKPDTDRTKATTTGVFSVPSPAVVAVLAIAVVGVVLFASRGRV
jgi:hypothetical protein